jgi:hypothetical protein
VEDAPVVEGPDVVDRYGAALLCACHDFAPCNIFNAR